MNLEGQQTNNASKNRDTLEHPLKKTYANQKAQGKNSEVQGATHTSIMNYPIVYSQKVFCQSLRDKLCLLIYIEDQTEHELVLALT